MRRGSGSSRAFAYALVGYALVAGGISTPADAQEGGPPRGPRREAPERRFERRIGRLVQQRLRLSDDQMLRLRAVNRGRAQQRQALFARERDARVGVRREIMRGDSADQRRVAALIDELFAVQRARLELLQAEQRELAEFLSPVQRARYLALQEQVHRRVGRALAEEHRVPRGRAPR
jgi:Spy/CpxP family protein refolding chaperone